MSEQTGPSPKSEAAIQVKVCGHDVHGRHFEEISTAFPSSKGVMLEIVHQLREGSALEITHLLSNQRAIAQVKSLGPKLGVSTLVFVEGADVEGLWMKSSAKEPERKREDDLGPMMTANESTLLAVPQRALIPISKSGKPNLNRFIETLNELVESVLEANLRPAVEQLANEIPEHVIRAQNSVLANLHEQIQAAVTTFGTRLDARALEVITRNENVLTVRIRGLIEDTLMCTQSRQDEFSRHLERELLAGTESVRQQVQGIVSERTAQFRETMQEDIDQLEKQFAERCRMQTEEKQNVLSACAQQMESNLAERLSGKSNGILDEFSAELEKRCEQALFVRMASVEKRLEETASALSESAQQVQTDFAGRLAQQANEIAERFHAELQKIFEQDLSGYRVRLQEQLALSASQFRQNFMEQIERELNEKQEKLSRQAECLMKDLSDQNRNRIVGLLRDLAQDMENQAAPVADAAD